MVAGGVVGGECNLHVASLFELELEVVHTIASVEPSGSLCAVVHYIAAHGSDVHAVGVSRERSHHVGAGECHSGEGVVTSGQTGNGLTDGSPRGIPEFSIVVGGIEDGSLRNRPAIGIAGRSGVGDGQFGEVEHACQLNRVHEGEAGSTHSVDGGLDGSNVCCFLYSSILCFDGSGEGCCSSSFSIGVNLLSSEVLHLLLHHRIFSIDALHSLGSVGCFLDGSDGSLILFGSCIFLVLFANHSVECSVGVSGNGSFERLSSSHSISETLSVSRDINGTDILQADVIPNGPVVVDRSIVIDLDGERVVGHIGHHGLVVVESGSEASRSLSLVVGEGEVAILVAGYVGVLSLFGNRHERFLHAIE